MCSARKTTPMPPAQPIEHAMAAEQHAVGGAGVDAVGLILGEEPVVDEPFEQMGLIGLHLDVAASIIGKGLPILAVDQRLLHAEIQERSIAAGHQPRQSASGVPFDSMVHGAAFVQARRAEIGSGLDPV